MKKYAIQYSIVQFVPYPDRAEAVNVGVVMFCPEMQIFNYKLLPKNRKTRVTQFFKTLPKNLFKNTVDLIEDEFVRVQKFTQQFSNSEALFQELIRPRESLIQYLPIRVALVDDLAKALAHLFNDLVEFESHTYNKSNEDAALKKRFNGILKQLELNKLYREKQLQVQTYGFNVTMPFYNEENDKSVKPLSFVGLKDEQAIIHHADGWRMKVDNLVRAQVIQAKQHLVTYEKPQETDFIRAFDFALEGLDKMGIVLYEINETQQIEQFIRVS